MIPRVLREVEASTVGYCDGDAPPSDFGEAPFGIGDGNSESRLVVGSSSWRAWTLRYSSTVDGVICHTERI